MLLILLAVRAVSLSVQTRDVSSSRARLEQTLDEEVVPGQYVSTLSGSARIEQAVAALESSRGVEDCFPLFPRDLMRIDGTWKLRYTNNAPRPLPRGALDVVPSFGTATRVFQVIDVFGRRVVNVVCVDPPADESLGETLLKRLPVFGKQLARAATRFDLEHSFVVDGEDRVRQAASTNRLRIELERVSRVLDGDFDGVPGIVRNLLFQPQVDLDLPPPLRAFNSLGNPAGTFDTTYCDGFLRVSRGISPIGRELRVFVKCDPADVPFARPPAPVDVVAF